MDTRSKHVVETTHRETVPSEVATVAHKWKVPGKSDDGDVALHLFRDHDINEPVDPDEERRLVRKIDLIILPLIAVNYAFFYIDKTTLSYAAIFGIRDDLHLHGTQYNWLSSKSTRARGKDDRLLTLHRLVLLRLSGVGLSNQLPDAETTTGEIPRLQHLPLGLLLDDTGRMQQLRHFGPSASLGRRS